MQGRSIVEVVTHPSPTSPPLSVKVGGSDENPVVSDLSTGRSRFSLVLWTFSQAPSRWKVSRTLCPGTTSLSPHCAEFDPLPTSPSERGTVDEGGGFSSRVGHGRVGVTSYRRLFPTQTSPTGGRQEMFGTP